MDHLLRTPSVVCPASNPMVHKPIEKCNLEERETQYKSNEWNLCWTYNWRQLTGDNPDPGILM